jgi:very-short-patch-repair endonuclease
MIFVNVSDSVINPAIDNVSDWSNEISENANVAEAKEILKLFRELREDDRYAKKSVGVLTFFNAQADLLRKVFEEAGFREDEDNFKISIIEGIQGDEKDIVIYSFVIRNPGQKRRYLPLTGEGGDIQGDINRGRVNVAFSRAKLQVHCFISMSIAEVPEGIWIKRYLEYVDKHGEVDFYNTELRDFDSYFEKEFYALLKTSLKKGYQLRNQVESCGFKIDFVVSNSRTSKQVAIECDGPTHFESEIDQEYGIYVEDDEERQRVLESAGWTFYRLKYVDWINESFDRKSVIADIIRLLD